MVFVSTLGIALSLSLGAGEEPPSAATVTVSIRGLRSEDGAVMAALFASKDGFPTKPKRAVGHAKSTGLSSGCATVVFSNVRPGTYAVAIFHDENGNGRLDTNFIGLPAEGVAASNDAQGRFGPPRWNKAKFEVRGATHTRAKIIYL